MHISAYKAKDIHTARTQSLDFPSGNGQLRFCTDPKGRGVPGGTQFLKHGDHDGNVMGMSWECHGNVMGIQPTG